MKRRITFNRYLFFFVTCIMTCFILVIGAVLARSLNDTDREYRRNLQFRSVLFRDSIRSSVVMGDYADALEKAQSFFQQSDVVGVRVDLITGENLVDLKRDLNVRNTDLVELKDSILISDEADGSPSGYAVAQLKTSYSLAKLKNVLAVFITQGLLVTFVFLAVAVIAVLLFSALFNKPLKELSFTATSGDLLKISRVVPDSKIIEIFELECAIRNMGSQLIDLNEKERENFKNAAVGRIIAHISHDLRTPLGIVERLLTVPDQEMPAMKGAIRDSLNRLYSMIESIRHSEVETIIKKSQSTFSLKFGIESLKGIAESRQLNLLATSIDFESVMIDSMKIERAWMNLASNAIDAAKSIVKVQADIQATDLVITVTDDGPGVSQELHAKLFERGATHGKSDGTGLGLAYVRQIMRSHGGDVRYLRENGLTVFECRIPCTSIQKEDCSMKNQDSSPLVPVSTIKRVAICLEPPFLAKQIRDMLAAHKNGLFSFSCDFDGAEAVVSNDEDILIRAIEAGKDTTQVKRDLPVDKILERLKRKFNLG